MSPSQASLDAQRRELDRLRQENARLHRLLDLREGETTPAAEQPAIPASAPGLVTIGSSRADKLALYLNRFRSRTDAYAVHWSNARAGRSGWSPAVAGGWRKGLGRGQARNLPLTRDVLTAHLAGDVFIGLYPLLSGNTCHWLAADFDGPAAMLDALAYIKAARSHGVPAALELSQSGRGAHAWVFFSDAVVAATARELGAGLIREAITMRGTMDLRSYDRLFPNQDVIPDGGYGNLIAAPLQGKRHRDGLTVFLDLATLEPHQDQWAYLSTLDRLSPGELTRAVRALHRHTVGSEVVALDRAPSTKVHPWLPAVVRAELGAGLVIDTAVLTPAALATLKHAASIRNPKFYELQRLRKSTWDTPRFIRGYDVTVDDRLVLPRGLRHRIGDLIAQAGSRLDVTDGRDAGSEIGVALLGDLRPQQETAISDLLAHDDGVLVAPPGSGKTVMACAAIAERGVATLILVDRKALAEQWRARIEQFLGVRPGQLGGGRKKLTGVVDIAMLPSLARRDDVAELASGYGQVIVDECHHLAAAAYDHSVKPIAARYWLGLTATPDRRDGLGELATWQLGPVRHVMGDEPHRGTLLDQTTDGPGPQRVLVLHETGFTHGEVDLSLPGALAEVHQALAADSERTAQIANDVADAVARGRNCLVLTRRVAHVEALREVLEERGHEALVLQGGMSVKRRRAVIEQLAETSSGQGVLVIGTTPFIGEGFDAPTLDTLFLAGPISFDGLLIQCVGRVIRAAPGKQTAIVHDYHDVNAPIVAASLKRRMPCYRELGFERRSG